MRFKMEFIIIATKEIPPARKVRSTHLTIRRMRSIATMALVGAGLTAAQAAQAVAHEHRG